MMYNKSRLRDELGKGVSCRGPGTCERSCSSSGGGGDEKMI